MVHALLSVVGERLEWWRACVKRAGMPPAHACRLNLAQPAAHTQPSRPTTTTTGLAHPHSRCYLAACMRAAAFLPPPRCRRPDCLTVSPTSSSRRGLDSSRKHTSSAPDDRRTPSRVSRLVAHDSACAAAASAQEVTLLL